MNNLNTTSNLDFKSYYTNSLSFDTIKNKCHIILTLNNRQIHTVLKIVVLPHAEIM